MGLNHKHHMQSLGNDTSE